MTGSTVTNCMLLNENKTGDVTAKQRIYRMRSSGVVVSQLDLLIYIQ